MVQEKCIWDYKVRILVFYSTGGPLTVNAEMPPILPAWFQSAQELGYNVGDPNGNQTEGK